MGSAPSQPQPPGSAAPASVPDSPPAVTPGSPFSPAPGSVRSASGVAFRISISYFAFGILWIIASDAALDLLQLRSLARFQMVKGCGFIAITAVLLYLLVRQFVRSIQNNQEKYQAQVQGIAEQYERLFSRNPCAMMIFHPETRRILAANDVALLLYGYSREELLRLTTFDLVVPEERPRVRSITPMYSSTGVVAVGPFQVRRRDGRIIFVEALTHAVEFGGVQARIAMVNDVTERLQTERSLSQYRAQLEQRVAERTAELSHTNRQLREEVKERQRVEEELRAATAAAEAANEAKSTFLANTSHEIRTPLTSILGYADLLADESLDPVLRSKYLEIVGNNARHLLTLIDDLLDLSRAEMGKVRVAFDDQSPREIAEQAVALLHPRASEKELALILRVLPGIPESLHTDGVRLRQILLNLLSNAIKFTHEGSVTLTLRPAPDVPGGICFDVTDTGIGMAGEHLHRVFDPFYQVEQGNTRRFGGFGLGLAISRELTHQMGGQLGVNSLPGQGSTFTLLLPPRPPGVVPPERTTPALEAAQLAGSVLLAEDTPNIRMLVSEYLQRAGARVTAVSDGAQAVAAIRQSLAAGEPSRLFDLVLLDLHMPVLDGAAAMRQIREAGFTGPVVGLSADYAEKTLEQWTREGWDAMASKPIDRQAFIPLLARLCHGPSRAGAAQD